MSSAEKRENNLIPLLSTEALWEWHIPSDTLFLSQGAQQKLGLTAETNPTTMAAFLSHVPAHCLAELHELRESALNGADGSFLETIYPFDTFFVRERMFILGRDEHGRANWTMGHYVVSHGSPTPAIAQDATQDRIGFWMYCVSTNTIRIDAQCATMLDFGALPRTLTLNEWLHYLYQNNNTANLNRQKFVIEQGLMGDNIEDSFLFPTTDGKTRHLLLRGAVLDRDTNGKAQHVTGTLQNLETTKAVKEQQQENGRLLFALNATGDGLWDWDAKTNTVYYSPRYLSMLGYTKQDFPGAFDAWTEKIHPEDRDKIVLPQQAIVESPRYGYTFECTYRIKRADGSWAWVLGRGYVTHRDATGRATRLVGMHTDVTTLQNGRAELEDRVKNDALTGLRSRAYCDMELERLEKEKVRPISIIACDVCGLKMINDHLGHAEGDKLLKKVALLLQHSLRTTDCVARTGGDEFIILLPVCPEYKASVILQQIEAHFESQNKTTNTMPVLVSFGLASTDEQTASLSRILATADKNMLRNKQTQRRATHRRIKTWIEQNTHECVSLEDNRCES